MPKDNRNKPVESVNKPKKPLQKSVIREWAETIIFAFLLAMTVRTFVIELFKIPSGSMRPTLLEGDRILVNKVIFGPRVPFTEWRLPGLREPRRGEVIVFLYPEDMRKNFIKRLVALPNETVEIRDGSIFINREKLVVAEFQQHYYYNRSIFGQEGKTITVPPDSYYVLGDNSGSSQDSRYWGFVPKKYLVGKAEIVYWPFDRFRLIK